MAGQERQDPEQDEEFLRLRHDIRNQLSNIQLALAGLEFECSSAEEDLALYISSIAESAKKIDKLLGEYK
ncbi:hypothetical protein D0C36_13185 [Mucilaginibacter conchicola]|uniref:Signal transduction histidine kinase dimerisation/phosphoacceptor domain-containing protein n=1 Tax=Mucilaginibacter conchicola TaxID=2303333 RepID=A0A372NT10_9SPHI|nr:hypothetical protein [Mucilaginibacter conchicola]RFZ92378.1 hypothetical protein D0C36_13185 [Mucilaginibacter conchicola]